MKTRFASILVFSLLFTPLFAQTGSITGVVTGSPNNEKIPYATIAVYPAGSEVPARGEASDGNGSFRIDRLPFGSYRVVVSFIGYEPVEVKDIDLSRQAPSLNMGTVTLRIAAAEIGQVDVVAQARTVTSGIDRTTYRATDFETARGGTATDVLSKLPAVSVNADGQVSVRGATDFLVYLNGKPTNIEPSLLLSQLSANSIENIEIITVPGARYDAQGAGGIINITTRRGGAEGLSVSTGLTGAGAPWGKTTDSYTGYVMNNDSYGANIDLLYNRNAVTLYTNLYYNKKNVNGYRNGTARILQENGNYYNLAGNGSRPELFENYSANAGLIFDISERSKLDVSYYFGHRGEKRYALYLYKGEGIVDNPGDDPRDYYTFNRNRGDRYGIINTANISYSLKMNNKADLAISAAWESSMLTRELSNPNYEYIEAGDQIAGLEKNIRQSDETPLTGLRLNIDFRKELAGGHRLEAGLQPQFLINSGSFSYDTLDVSANAWGSFSSLENDFELRRGIYATYLNYSGKTGGLEFMAGIRGEYTDQAMDVRNPDYFNLFNREPESQYTIDRLSLFPSLHLSYRVFETDDISLSASRRINRPQTQTMAPFLYRRHHEVYEVGDPALQPELLTTVEASYMKRFGNNNIRLTGFYRGTNNAIFRIYTIYPEENILIRSFTNAGNSKSMGAEINTNLMLGSVARVFLGGSLYRFNVKGEFFGTNEDNTSTNWSLKGNLNLFITKTLRFVTDFDFKSATVTAQGRDKMIFLSGASLSWSPEKMKGWNFALRAVDMLGTNITNWSTRAYDSSGTQVFFQETDYTRYGPIAELGITYSFNLNGRNIKRSVKTFGEEQF